MNKSAFKNHLRSNAFLTKDLFVSVNWNKLSYILFVFYVIIIIFTFLDYGITYDENWHYTYGEHIVQWFSSGFQDKGALTYWTLPLQGGFSGTLARLATRISPLGDFETSHLVNAIFGFLGVVGAFKLSRFLGGPFAGFLSVLFLILTPRFYGHTFNNPVDIPMATFSIFVVYYLIRTVSFLPHPPKALIAKLGLVLGLALAVRVGAVILVGYIVLAFCLWLAYRYLFKLKTKGNNTNLNFRSSLLKISGTFSFICIIAYLVMLCWWPAAQIRPIYMPAKGLWYATRFGYSIDVFFEGMVFSNKNLPWYYVLKWFLITLPEFYFIAFGVGLILVSIFLSKTKKELRLQDNRNALEIVILVAAATLPIIYTVTGVVEYDGIRHYLFVIPFLAVIAAVSIVKLFRRVFLSFISTAVAVIVFASMALTVVDMVQLHPHQYIFFNRLFGGSIAEAADAFETDYWGNSYKEGVEWIVRNYNDRHRDKKVKVASCLYSLSTSYYLPEDRFDYVGSYHDGQVISKNVVPDLFLATTRWNCHKKLDGQVLHTIERRGVPLLYIIEVHSNKAR
jgi:hypothetical protein